MVGSGSDGTEDSDSSAEREQTNSSESDGNTAKRQRLTRASTRLSQSSQGWPSSRPCKVSTVCFLPSVTSTLWFDSFLSFRYSGFEAGRRPRRVSAVDAYGKCALFWVRAGHLQPQRLPRREPGQGSGQQRLWQRPAPPPQAPPLSRDLQLQHEMPHAGVQLPR